MKILPILLLFLASLSPVQQTSAQTTLETTDYLNLRLGPGTWYDVLAVMPPGATVEVAGQTEGPWWPIVYAGTFGWAHGDWLTEPGNNWLSSSVFFPTVNPWEPTREQVIQEIYYWADYYGVSRETLYRVAQCESNFNPSAVGYFGEIGVFQFMPGTFYGYGDGDPWYYKDNIRVAAMMFSQGLSYHWVCK